VRVVEAGRNFELVDEDCGIFDFSFGDSLDDSESVGKDSLLGHVDHPIGSSSEFLPYIMIYFDELEVVLDLVFVVIDKELLLEKVRFHHYLLYHIASSRLTGIISFLVLRSDTL
jgi:hypothetical protein